jgi:phosphoribosylaminoimidazole-succinocarboxamide synthase
MKDIIKNQLQHTLNDSNSELKNLGRHYRGKVRDNYYFDNQILMITSDRVSAFDHVLGTIPFKGEILSNIASFWFDKTKNIVPNHYIKSIDSQVLLVKEAKPLPVEVIVRKYITGSLWRDYKNSKHHVYDLDFDDNLVKNQKFSTPILTPSTKEEYGKHDQPISKKEIINQKLVDKNIYELAEKYALQLFSEGEKWAKKQGLILVDTKYEFGLVDNELIVIDEIHTPDSSRYWISDEYETRFQNNENQLMLDKENIRQWLIGKGFSGEGRPPELDDDIRILLSQKYIELHNILTGNKFIPSVGDVSDRIQNNLKNAGF